MTVDATPQSPQGKQRSWLRIAFIASLVANMLLLGVVGGAMVRPGGGHWHKGHGPGEFMRQLPSERREAIRAQFLKDREELKGKREQVRELRERALALIGKEPFDAAAAKAAVAEIGAARSEMHRLAGERFVELLAGMSLEERRIFIEERRSRRWRRRGGDRGDDGRDGL